MNKSRIFFNLKSLAIVLTLVIAALYLSKEQKPGSANKFDLNKFNREQSPNKKDLSLQVQRKAFIEQLKANNIIHKIEVPGTLPKLTVAPGFYALSFDDKKAFCDAILSYYFVQSSSYNILKIHDYYTGNQIGRFDESGLHLN